MSRAEILESRNKTDWKPLEGNAGVGSSPVPRLAGVQHEVLHEAGVQHEVLHEAGVQHEVALDWS